MKLDFRQIPPIYYRALLVGFVLFFLSVILSTLIFGRLYHQITFPDETDIVSAVNDIDYDDPTPAPLPQDLQTVNILLLGHGDAGHQGGNLTDAMLLAHFDPQNNRFALISIPRDSWVKFPDGVNRKLNSAFSLDPNSAAIAKTVISQITGLNVNYFIDVNFFGLTAIVDELDGIDVNLPQSFEDPWYPIRGKEQDPCEFSPAEIAELTNTLTGFELEKQFTCRYEQLSFKVGINHIDGATALKLARSRHSGSDFARSQRQQAILLGIKDKLLSLDALGKIGSIYHQLEHTFHSDLDLGITKSLADLIIEFPQYHTILVNLSTTNVLQTGTGPGGQFILIPKSNESGWASIRQYINQELNFN